MNHEFIYSLLYCVLDFYYKIPTLIKKKSAYKCNDTEERRVKYKVYFIIKDNLNSSKGKKKIKWKE